MAEFNIKRGDLAPVLTATLRDGSNAVLDLTGCTVVFRMREKGLVLADTVKVESAATILSPATAGRVQYTWVSGDTDTAAYYAGEWVVTYPGPIPLTAPGQGFIYVRVNPNLEV